VGGVGGGAVVVGTALGGAVVGTVVEAVVVVVLSVVGVVVVVVLACVSRLRACSLSASWVAVTVLSDSVSPAASPTATMIHHRARAAVAIHQPRRSPRGLVRV
jgi:hypothetical protein